MYQNLPSKNGKVITSRHVMTGKPSNLNANYIFNIHLRILLLRRIENSLMKNSLPNIKQISATRIIY